MNIFLLLGLAWADIFLCTQSQTCLPDAGTPTIDNCDVVNLSPRVNLHNLQDMNCSLSGSSIRTTRRGVGWGLMFVPHHGCHFTWIWVGNSIPRNLDWSPRAATDNAPVSYTVKSQLFIGLAWMHCPATRAPTFKPTRHPTSLHPTRLPSLHPTPKSTLHPTFTPTHAPSLQPSLQP